MSSPELHPEDIKYANSRIFNWAVCIVGDCAYKEVRNLTKTAKEVIPGVPPIHPRLVATANERTREDILSFGVSDRVKAFRARAWHLTQSMCAPRRNGEVVIRQREPPDVVPVASVSIAYTYLLQAEDT
uniref:Uncharacterized protein n=1 Tax=Moniliophthora roreri TaxID=221103 RepID=A0A0W0FT05_MONRR